MGTHDRKTGAGEENSIHTRSAGGKMPCAASDPQAILESVDVGIVHLDRKFCLAYVNAKAADILGKSREELAGRVLGDAVPEETGRELVRELGRCREKRVPVSFETFCPGREDRWFGCSCAPSSQGYTLIVQDITERKQAEENLKESESRYHSLFENNHAVMLLIKPGTGRIVDANPAAAAYYGYTREQLTSMAITEINTLTREQVLEEMKQARSQQRQSFMFRHRLANGEVRDVTVYSGPIVVSGETLLYSIVHDITDQKQARENLRESEERYRTLYETMAQGVIEYDEAGRIIASNPAASKIMGIDLDSLKGMSINDVLGLFGRTAYREDGTSVRGEDLPSLKAMKEGRPVSNYVMRIDGAGDREHRWMSIYSIPRFRPGQERLEGIFSIFSDITPARQAQEDLKKTNEQLEQKVKERTRVLSRTVERVEKHREVLQTIIDNIPVMLTFYDASGRISLASRELERLLGWSTDEMRDMDLMTAVYPEPVYRREVWEYMKEAKPGWRDFEMTTRSGGVVHASWTNVRLSDGSRIGIGIDVSQRIQMEQDLRMLAKAIEQAGEGIAIFSPQWAFEYINPAYEALSGYQRDELMGRRITTFADYLVGSGFEEVIEYVTRKGKEWSGRQKRIRKTTGSAFDISLTVTPVYGQEGTVTNFIEVVRDITDEVRLQEQLSQNRKLEAIGTLAGGIVHDLKNILTPIVTNTEIALMDVEDGHPAHELLQEIMQAARMGTDLVSRVMTFSRKGPQEMKPTVIEPVVSETMDFLRSALPSSIDIRRQLSGGDAVVMADPTRIKQVIINLGTNAGHAMRERGGVLEVKLMKEHLSEEEAAGLSPDLSAGGYVRIVVRDTGEGMDEQTMQRVFEPFFTTKKPGEGTGMGLAVVHGIVKEHNGAVAVRSTPGKGSTFSILLPVIKEDENRTAR
jgi:PAS domain S-box-containing protein